MTNPPPQDHGPHGPTPGVIPLRPLGVGTIILDGALGYIRTSPWLVLGVSAVAAVLEQVVIVAALLAFSSLVPGILAIILTSILALIVTFIAYGALNGLLLTVLGRAVLGRRVELGYIWRTAAPRLPGLVGLSLLIGLIITAIGAVPAVVLIIGATVAGGMIPLGVFLFLLALPLAIWLLIRWSLAAPAYVFEDIDLVTAMSRSSDLVRGAWWRAYWVFWLVGLISCAVSGVISLPARGIPVTSFGPDAPPSLGDLVPVAISTIIASTFVAPFSIGATGLLYVDQRIRRERYDVELARSATAQE